MGRTTQFTLVASFLLLVRSGALAAPDETAPTLDKYKELVRTTSWAWREERANILYSLEQADPGYDVVLVRPASGGGNLKLRIMDGQREVYAWDGHVNTVFCLTKGRLYYVNYGIGGPGGSLVAVDLKTGKKLWDSQLRGIGYYPPHSIYSNLMNVSVAGDGEAVSVFGNEERGRYFEIKDAKTGETVGHKVFKDPPPPARK